MIQDLGVENELIFFANGKRALDYLLETPTQPFLILCDVNMPVMNGLELLRATEENDFLRKKAIAFVFLTTTANANLLNEASFQSVQGFYQKASTFPAFQQQMKSIIEYWQGCRHPNSYLFT